MLIKVLLLGLASGLYCSVRCGHSPLFRETLLYPNLVVTKQLCRFRIEHLRRGATRVRVVPTVEVILKIRLY